MENSIMARRKPVIAGNWKMNKTQRDAADFVAALPDHTRREDSVEMILCAPFTALSTLQTLLKDTQVQLGAQNMYHEPSGAYTGEISADMLRAVGCQYVVLGHSERREIFQENDVLVNLKLKATLSNGMNPILCIGESLQEREAGQFEEKLLNQVELGLAGINMSPSLAERILIAYEPIWAIGTGKTCDESEANRILGLLRHKLTQLYGVDRAQQMRLLYGGSVKPSTIESQIQQSDIDGALVGGASLEAESFAALVSGCKAFGN